MSTIKCMNCGMEIKEESKFCPNCGERLEQKKCPKCGETIVKDDKFCSKCGCKLQEDSFIENSKVEKINLKNETENPISFIFHNFSRTFLWFVILIASYVALNCIPVIGSLVASIVVFIEFIKLVKVFIEEYSTCTKQYETK